MKKIVFRSLLALTLSISMVACSSDDSNAETPTEVEINASELPTLAVEYLKGEFAGVSYTAKKAVTEQEDGVEFIAVLANDLEVGFDVSGNVVDFNGSPEALAKAPVGNLPYYITNFVYIHFAGPTSGISDGIRKAKYTPGKHRYAINLASGIELWWTQDATLGTWQYYEINGHNRLGGTIPHSVIGVEFPLVAAFLQENYPGTAIKKVERNSRTIRLVMSTKKRVSVTFLIDSQEITEVIDNNR